VPVPASRVGQCINFVPEKPLALDCGKTLSPLTVAFMTYGTLNAAHSNAVLICHALTLDQFVASANPITGKPGWWETMVGPGKAIDTDRFFVICANVVGGCMGTTGPAETSPATGRPYGLDFPLVTVRDMVRAQAMLLDALDIEKVLCVTGGSMGGMQVLQWAADFPDRVVSAVPIACAARHSAQNIAFHEVGRQAIMADPDWKGGTYQLHGTQPAKGLAVARMAAHITYLSEAALQRKFGRNLQDREQISFGFGPDFQIESYLHHQGVTFVDRFDANSYLYITRAMDYFDLAAEHDGKLADALAEARLYFSLSQRLAVSHHREQAHRPCAQCQCGDGQLRRDSDRSRPRRVSSGRTGTVRDDARLSELGGGEGGSMCLVLRAGLAAIAEMMPYGERVLDVGWRRALLEHLSAQKVCRRSGPNCRNRMSMRCVRAALRWCKAMPIPTLGNIQQLRSMWQS
jgi:homoserine O-acetyltransferase